MIGLLVKAQLMEIFRGYFVSRKTNKGRSVWMTIGLFVLFALLMVGVIGGMFFFLAKMLVPVTAFDLGWYYYCLFGILAIVMGAFGSVFNTYSALYLGKDNARLLCLPIPVRDILVSRLATVFLMGLLYSAVVSIPAVIVYQMYMGFTVQNVLGGILWILLISLLVLVLSCVLGYAVARISLKIRNNSYVVVALSIVFIVLYYYFYFKLSGALSSLLQNAVMYGEEIRAHAYPLYVFGRAGEGEPLSVLLFALFTALLLALTWFLLNKSFIGIAASVSASTGTKYREKPIRQKSAASALLEKELRRFTGSSGYMLNCGMGILLMPAMGIFLLVKGAEYAELMASVFGDLSNYIPVVAATAVCMASSMNDISAPSVSLEGKSIWILKSLPLSAKQILLAKLRTHLVLTVPCVLFLSLCMLITLPFRPLGALLVLVLPLVFVFLTAAGGLVAGLLWPNLNWTNEIYPIKQSLSVFACLMGGWAYGILVAGLYFFKFQAFGAENYLLVVLAITAAAAIGAAVWLFTKGAERFDRL